MSVLLHFVLAHIYKILFAPFLDAVFFAKPDNNVQITKEYWQNRKIHWKIIEPLARVFLGKSFILVYVQKLVNYFYYFCDVSPY